MKQLLFIFCSIMCTTLQTSDNPIDFNNFQFYLKYGTRQETSEMINQLKEIKQQKIQKLAKINNDLSQEIANYKNANEHTKQIISTYKDHNDLYTAWNNWLHINHHKNLADCELAKIDMLKQSAETRLIRLNLRKQTYQLTEQQEKLRQAQRSALIAAASKKDEKAHVHDKFKQIQKQTEPLLNRMINQSKQASNLEEYIAVAKTQANHKKEATQKKIAERQAHLLAQKEERIKQKEEAQQKLQQEQQARSDLQALAYPRQSITQPTEAERQAQSERDKESARATTQNYSSVSIMHTIHQRPSVAQLAKNNHKYHNNKQVTKRVITEHDPLEPVNSAFESLLQTLNPKKDDDGNLLFKATNKIHVEKAIQKLHNEINSHKSLFFDTLTKNLRTSEHLKNLNKLSDRYKALQKDNDNKIEQFHIRAKNYSLPTNKRFLYYKSAEFERHYKALANSACTRGNHQQAAKAEFLKLKAELKSCAQDELIFEEGMHLEYVLNKIQELQTSMHSQTNIDKNRNDDNFDDDYGFVLPACTVT